jgi:hypothetical protein
MFLKCEPNEGGKKNQCMFCGESTSAFFHLSDESMLSSLVWIELRKGIPLDWRSPQRKHIITGTKSALICFREKLFHCWDCMLSRYGGAATLVLLDNVEVE